MNFDDLLIDESGLLEDSNTDVLYEQYLCEWKVDADKKKKIIQKSISTLQKEVDKEKNKILSKGVVLYKLTMIDEVNLTLFNKLFKKNSTQTKTRKLIIGHYDFRVKDVADAASGKAEMPYRILKRAMDNANNDLENVKFSIGTSTEMAALQNILSIIPIPVLRTIISVAVNALMTQKVGTIWMNITDKKSIKKESGMLFAESVMNELFNDEF